MNTLEEIQVYFEVKGYKVRQYSDLNESEVGISVFGKCKYLGGAIPFIFRSAITILLSHDGWILRTIVGQRIKDEPFETIQGLLPVAEDVLVSPIDEV